VTACSRPERWTPEVITIRADTDDGWATLCKEFGAGFGRPIVKPEKPWLAIFGRVTPTRLGWPVYVRADDALGVMRYQGEKLAEARVVAHENNAYVDYWEATQAAEAATTSDEMAAEEAQAKGPDAARGGRKAAKRKRPGANPAAKNADAGTPHSEKPSVPASVPNQGETK
jgi:hypothetical protein